MSVPSEEPRRHNGALTYLEVLREMDPSPETLRYIEEREAALAAQPPRRAGFQPNDDND